MEKILIQRLVEPSNGSHTAFLIGAAIAHYVRLNKGSCDYIPLRAASPADVDVGFLRGIDTHAVVVDVELEVPQSVRSEFDYVVTVQHGDPAFESFVRCATCGMQYGRSARGQYTPCACGYCEPTARPPSPRRGAALRRFLKFRPFGHPASA
ncbi:hypothetical protein F3J20_22655 [Paraburkholderia sp. Cy-641]|uniref:hypothetical protein n=1 Tax=Paraburkholderia sp. Cy-641 TaxID=2608337 RepID=UPI001423A40D|nr:hypothetical protein [Paraburkholderia sp. Cy-641]NIF80159.1 hypothetical protein [Paraburkholderia sp. Cy-641]